MKRDPKSQQLAQTPPKVYKEYKSPPLFPFIDMLITGMCNNGGQYGRAVIKEWLRLS